MSFSAGNFDASSDAGEVDVPKEIGLAINNLMEQMLNAGASQTDVLGAEALLRLAYIIGTGNWDYIMMAVHSLTSNYFSIFINSPYALELIAFFDRLMNFLIYRQTRCGGGDYRYDIKLAIENYKNFIAKFSIQVCTLSSSGGGSSSDCDTYEMSDFLSSSSGSGGGGGGETPTFSDCESSDTTCTLVDDEFSDDGLDDPTTTTTTTT